MRQPQNRFGLVQQQPRPRYVDLGQRFGENKEFGVRANGNCAHGDTPRHGYSEDNKELP